MKSGMSLGVQSAEVRCRSTRTIIPTMRSVSVGIVTPSGRNRLNPNPLLEAIAIEAMWVLLISDLTAIDSREAQLARRMLERRGMYTYRFTQLMLTLANKTRPRRGYERMLGISVLYPDGSIRVALDRVSYGL